MGAQAKLLYRFGSFQLDVGERVLIREGVPVPLPPKAFDVLLALVNQHGHIVEKDALLKAAWPDAFVEEGNLPVNVSLLRKVLGDDPQNGKRYIETVPRRGYRFVAPVTAIVPEVQNPASRDGTATPQTEIDIVPAPGSNGAAAPQSQRASAEAGKRLGFALAAAAGVVAALAGCAWLLVRSLPAPTVSTPKQLTNDGLGKGYLATDGQRLYFTEWSPKGQPVLKQMSVNGGEASLITTPASNLAFPDVSSDFSTLLLSAAGGTETAIWLQPLPAGSPRRLGNLMGRDASWSPDGRRVAFCRGYELWVSGQDGSEQRKITAVPGVISWPRWSPDGSLLRFTASTSTANRSASSLWEVSSAGGSLHPLLETHWNDPPREAHGSWTPEGRYFVFDSGKGGQDNIWAIREKAGLHRQSREPMQLTNLPQGCSNPLLSPDGKRVFFLAHTEQGHLERFSRGENQFVRFLDGVSAEWVAFSRDKNWVAYVKYPERTLWRMKNDGTEVRQLAFSPMKAQGLAWSPDGRQIAFNAWTATNRYKNYLVAANGREERRELQQQHSEMEGIPSWSPDGRKIAFGDVPENFGHGTRSNVIHILNLLTRKSEMLQHSQGFWSPRWSPDGRYITALKNDDPDPDRQALWLYDCEARTWRDLHVDHVGDVVWSHDSEYIYYDGEGGGLGIFRMRVPSGKPEMVADTNRIRIAGDAWFGLAPDDSPLILRDAGIEEIYSADVDWR